MNDDFQSTIFRLNLSQRALQQAVNDQAREIAALVRMLNARSQSRRLPSDIGCSMIEISDSGGE